MKPLPEGTTALSIEPRSLAELILAAPIRALWRLYHLAWWPQRALLNRADAVVTVSETTAALIAEIHRLRGA